MKSDVLIVGGGPSGLSLAISLAVAGLKVKVIEQQNQESLENPAEDGREIALTCPSVETMTNLGLWQNLKETEIGNIRKAVVHNGIIGKHKTLEMDTMQTGLTELGKIVPNYAIRRAAFTEANKLENIEIITESKVINVEITEDLVNLEYQNNQNQTFNLTSKLVVAADSRHSQVRRMLGVGASLTDFGRTVIVCRLRHQLDHENIAHECFGDKNTLAILPLPADEQSQICSAVVTTNSAFSKKLIEMSKADFSSYVQEQFQNRLGSMELLGERFAYPLVATYSDKFCGERFVLLGDAAVGMHPVTAHGFNLGLSGVERLAKVIIPAYLNGEDFGSFKVLSNYSKEHNFHAWPIFQGTNAIVKLFTDSRKISSLLRKVVIRTSSCLPPLQATIVAQLTGKSLLQTLLPQNARDKVEKMKDFKKDSELKFASKFSKAT